MSSILSTCSIQEDIAFVKWKIEFSDGDEMKKRESRRLEKLRARAEQLASTLGGCWPLHDGSVSVRYRRCGKANCACHRDDSRRHGPYATWTTKVGGKTVARRLTMEEAEVVGQWIESRRRLERTVKELMSISKEMLPLVLQERARSGA